MSPEPATSGSEAPVPPPAPRAPGSPPPGSSPAPGAPPPGALRAVLRAGRDAWRSDASGPNASELRDAQRDAILSRATVLAWLAVAGFPIAAIVFALAAPARITPALVICAVGFAASLGMPFAIARGAFRVRYQLAMFVLVGLVLGPAAATLVETSIDDETIKPRRKLRLAAKLTNRGEQLQKDLLRDVVSDGAVAAGGIDGDREHPVFVGFEEELKGSAVALLASFDNPSIDKLFSHHHQDLDVDPRGSLPKNRTRITRGVIRVIRG